MVISRSYIPAILVCLFTLCVFVSLSGCASPAKQEVKPLVDAPIITDTYFLPGDGAKLPITRWGASARKPSAVILALHGFNDYSQAYAFMGKRFADEQIAVYAYDQRGFGANDNAGIWGNSENLTRDAGLALQALAQKHPNIPLYVMGESMGGAVAIATIAGEYQGTTPLSGVILSAPALWGADTMNIFYRAALWTMVRTFPSKVLTGDALNIMPSDNLDMLRRMSLDPLVIKASRVDSIHGVVQLMDKAQAQVGMVNVPILLLYGGKDQVIPPYPIAKGIAKFSAPYTMAFYPEGYHLLTRDNQRETVLKDILSWLNNRYKPLPSGYDMGWRSKLDPYF